MPNLLKDLVIDRVDLVEEGANSAAFISLYKRKEQTTMDIKTILEKMAPEQASVVQTEIDRLSLDITKANETINTLTTEKDGGVQALAKANEELTTTKDALDVLKSDNDVLKSSQEASRDEAEIIKAMPEPAQAIFIKMKAQKEAAEESVCKAREAEEHAVAVAKAANLKALPIEQEKLVGILKKCSPELFEVLTGVNAAIESTVLGEVGKSNPGAKATSSDEAWAKIEVKALEIEKSKGMTKAKSISQAVNENPDLYKEYLKGGAN